MLGEDRFFMNVPRVTQSKEDSSEASGAVIELFEQFIYSGLLSVAILVWRGVTLICMLPPW